MADRQEIRADETVNLTIRLSGRGNLRVAPSPGWEELEDFEVYSHGSEDSLDLGSTAPRGTKRVSLALLPRRQGKLTIPPLRYAVYEPDGGYRTLTTAPISLQVIEPLAQMAGTGAISPLPIPRAVVRPPRPWPGWTLALIALGVLFLAGAWTWRGLRSGTESAEASRLRSDQAALREAKGKADDVEYLRLAERSLVEWGRLADRLQVEEEHKNAGQVLLDRVRGARYAPSGASRTQELAPMLERQADALRRLLKSRQRLPWAPIAVSLVAALVIAGGLGYGMWRSGTSPAELEIADEWQAAHDYLQEGREAEAVGVIESLWSKGFRSGPLAAQAAVAALRDRELGYAALWSERARREDPRDPFVQGVRTALDEEGGLPGHPEGPATWLTSRDLLLGSAIFLALAGLLGALSLTVRRLWWIPAAAFAGVAVAGLLFSVSLLGEGFGSRGGVALGSTSLYAEPDGRPQLDLEPGRLVEILDREGDWVHVHLGGNLKGWVRAADVVPIGESSPAPPTAFLSR